MEYQISSFKEEKDKKHKYQVIILDLTTGKKHLVRFGQYGSNDFTLYTRNDNEDKERHKRNYLNRHRKNEDWTLNGIKSAGFWSRWILWNKPTVESSLENVIKKFKIKLSD